MMWFHAFTHFASLCYIFIIHTMFQIFLLLYLCISYCCIWCHTYFYVLYYIVMFDVTTVTVLRHRKQHLYKMVTLTDRPVFWLLHQMAIPCSLSFSLGLPIPLNMTVLKSDQLIIVQCLLRAQVKERVAHLSL